jgi:surface antigen
LINSDSTQLEKNLVARDSFDGFLIASSLVDTTLTVRTEPLPDNNKSGVVYIVREGDTLSKLASAFGLKIATIKYANDMTNDVIRPGSKLTISARGNNVSAVAIAKKEAQKLALANRNTVTRDQSKNRTILVSTYAGKRGSSINGYPYGWCTYYAASRRNIPSSWGNAGQWLRSANSHGWSTGKQPQAGAVVVTGESFMGHVAVVEKVEGGKIIISEMNGPAGFGVVGLRSIPLDSKKIKGYIY